MKFSYNWLKEFVKTDLPARETADILTSLGLEAKTDREISIPGRVAAAKILKIEKHPDADRLSVCDVDAGPSGMFKIVCGAPNVEAGMVYPLAVEGCRLNGGIKVKKTKIRGVESCGMLCSERELGISDEHSGLMALPEDIKPGTPVNTIIPNDTVIETELTPNRGDCLSILGTAQELSASLQTELTERPLFPSEDNFNVSDEIDVVIENSTDCPRYTGRLIKGVKIKESPLWLRLRLIYSGIRPINNIVDITNYMLLMYGQPMHAFDFNSIKGKKLTVRSAEKGMKFTTLDEQERALDETDLMIYDGDGPAALAGIMGGRGSGIEKDTADVFLECAYFNPVTIRKSAKRLNISTESSHRFERGVDYDTRLLNALNTAASLITELGGGRVARGIIDEYPSQIRRKPVRLRKNRLSRVTGADIPQDFLLSAFSSLGITLDSKTDEEMIFIPPSFRHDIEIEEDLIEEAGRVYGYDKIPQNTKSSVKIDEEITSTCTVTGSIRKSLSNMGLYEIKTNSMVSKEEHDLFFPETEPVSIVNPLNPDMAVMRSTLLGSFCRVTAYNINRKNFNNRFFETSKVFFPDGKDGLPLEKTVVSILIEGDYIPQGLNSPAVKADFYILKGLVDRLAGYLGVQSLDYSRIVNSSLFGIEAADISFRTLVSGYAGRVSKRITGKFQISSPVYFAELDITELIRNGLKPSVFSGIPKYPAVERAFCFLMPESMCSGRISNTILRISELVQETLPFDIYRDENLGKNMKSVTYSVQIRAGDRTLKEEEIESLSDSIIRTVKKNFNVKLRS